MTLVEPALESKLHDLEQRLADLRRVIVAFSGGVDSSFLAEVAHRVLGSDSLAVTADSPSLARRDLASARELAAARGWNHRVVETNEVHRADYARNAPDRCYWCKTELFEVLAPLARDLDSQVVVGTNLDDLGDYRPGLKAARRHEAATPLADARLTKDEIRALSAREGLPTAPRPASPCLASRVSYGIEVTPERLARIEAAEDLLASLGFDVLRVRDHGDLARIEVPAERIPELIGHRELIERRLEALGWSYVSLDLGGFRAGSMNRVLAAPRLGGSRGSA